MANTKIDHAAAAAALDAIVDTLDAGAGAGYIEIRVGAPPASVEDAATGTLLGTLTCSDPAFGAATTADPSVATAGAITDDTNADASGVAGWFRAYDSTAVARIQGDISTVAAGTGDLQLDDTNIVAGGTISVTGWTISHPA